MKAKLVQNKDRNGFRAIVQHETSNNSFHPSYPNVSEYVEIVKADDDTLRASLVGILKGLGVVDPVINEISEGLIDKFKKELASSPLLDGNVVGSLAYDEATCSGFYLITQKYD